MAEIVWAPNALDDVEKLIAYIDGDSIVSVPSRNQVPGFLKMNGTHAGFR